LGFSIDLLRRRYDTLALPSECVIQQFVSTFQGGERETSDVDPRARGPRTDAGIKTKGPVQNMNNI